MTDIIELTQRMREAAENATRGEWIKENGDGWEAICCDDDQANGNFIIAKFLGPDKARNREFVQAVQPQNIRTLCDALAQRDAQIAALKDDFIRLDRQMSVLERTGITDRDRADKAEAQLAELAKQEPVEWMLQCWDDTAPEENRWFNYQRYTHRVTAGKNQRVIEYFTRPAPPAPLSLAAADVIAERQRQVNVEGWTPAHDDTHHNNEMAFAASCYAFHAAAASWDLEDDEFPYDAHPVPKQWPWDDEWWKPKSPRRDLVRAAALILAEIERLDRAKGGSVADE